RHTGRLGKDTVDHAPGSHDDLCNAACGAIQLAGGKEDPMAIWAKLAQPAVVAPAPAPPEPEKPAPDQLTAPLAPPGSPPARRLAQRRAARMVSTTIERGEATVLMSVPKDIFILEGHSQPATCVPEGSAIPVPTRLASHPYLRANGAQVVDGDQTRN